MNGIEESIPLEQVLSSTKADLGLLGESKYDPLLEKFICDAVKSTRSGQLVTIKKTTLTLKDGEADLPKGYRGVVGIRFLSNLDTTFELSGVNIATTYRGTTTPASSLGSNGNTYVKTVSPFTFYIKTAGTWVETQMIGGRTNNTTCNQILMYDDEMASACGCSSGFQRYAKIRDGKICVTNVPDEATDIEFFYRGTVIGDDCLYIIPVDFERACSAYAQWKFYRAFPEVKGDRISLSNAADAKNEWTNQAKMLRGIAARKEWDENKYFISRLLTCWFAVESNY